MVGIIAALLLSRICILPAVAHQIRPDREQDELTGPVKKVRTEAAEIQIKAGQIREKNRSLYETRSYDANGNLVERVTRTRSGSLDKAEYRYDEKGRQLETLYLAPRRGSQLVLITKTGRLESSDQPLITRWEYEHDEDGHRTRAVGYHSLGSKLENLYKYEDGKKVEATTYVDGRFVSRTIYIRDEKGSIVEQIEYDANGKLSSRKSYSYEYDPLGNWVKRITSLWVRKAGKTYFEPKEIRYRTIDYH